MNFVKLLLVIKRQVGDCLNKKSKPMKRIILFWFVCFTSILSVNADPVGSFSVFDLMYQSDLLDIRIEGDFSKLIEQPETEEYEQMTLDFSDPSGTQHQFDVKVRPRGKFRRKVCDFPPLRLKFKKDDLEAIGLAREFNKMKLVTHCMDERYISRDNILKEYVAYRMYQSLSPNSYRVQLVQVTYVDTGLDGAKTKRYGILIETTDQLAERLNAMRCDTCVGKTPEQLQGKNLVRLQLFQYMIGNADWNLSMYRNLKFVQVDGQEKWIGVPYDFDFSGLVNAPYALPNPDYNLQSVQERAFLGGSPNSELLEVVYQEFESKRKTFERLIKSAPRLSGLAKKEALEYLDSFL